MKGIYLMDGLSMGMIPGPTMRVTQGDHVRIKVINSPENQHAHSLHLHSIHPLQWTVSESVGIKAVRYPQEVASFTNCRRTLWCIPIPCHVERIADHINRGLYGFIHSIPENS